MKRTLAMIFLAVLTVGLLGSCTKSYDERLDKIDSDVFGLKEAVGQYESLSGDITSVIEALRAEIGTRPASEQQSVWNCIAALQNQKGTFDAAIAALNALVGEKPVSEQIDGAVAKLTSKYQLESLSADIQAIKDKLTEKTGISALSDKVAQLQKNADIVTNILSEIDDYGRMIQSVRINPASADGSVKAESGILKFTFTVTPAEALSGVKNLAKCLKLYANEVEVKTKAGVFDEISVTSAEIIDAEKGEVSVEADVTDYLPLENTSALSVALNVRTGVSNYTTEFVKVRVPGAPDGFVDLGVKNADGNPLYWAECNLGASKPEEYGKYFSWGDVTGQTPSGFTFSKSFSWDNDVFGKTFNIVAQTTACPDGVLTQTYDAAYQTNNAWRMPTREDFTELAKQCFLEWTDNYNSTGVKGVIVWKAKSGDAGWFKPSTAGKGCKIKEDGSGYDSSVDHTFSNTYAIGTDPCVFFPAAGYGLNTGLESAGSSGRYWSSSLCTGSTDRAYDLSFSNTNVSPQNNHFRSNGFSVRPVSDAE